VPVPTGMRCSRCPDGRISIALGGGFNNRGTAGLISMTLDTSRDG